jgi:predicted deacetylase
VSALSINQVKLRSAAFLSAIRILAQSAPANEFAGGHKKSASSRLGLSAADFESAEFPIENCSFFVAPSVT